MWTGDLPAHNEWNVSRDDLISDLQTLTGWFSKYFPNKMIFSAIGNHESVPEDRYNGWLEICFVHLWNQYWKSLDTFLAFHRIQCRNNIAFHGFIMSWRRTGLSSLIQPRHIAVYNGKNCMQVSESLYHLLLNEQFVFRRASYMVKPLPGLRLISLNTQYCNTYNL